jgi:polyphosphate kinase
MTPSIDLNQNNLYINRELSLLEFIRRVLKLAEDTELPILERLKFLFICSTILDEFFEVRVAGVKRHQVLGSHYTSGDGLTPQELLIQISSATHKIVSKIYQVLNNELIPSLEKENIHLVTSRWNSEQNEWVQQYFTNEVLPLISPIALDVAHPFPLLANKSLNFIVTLEGHDAFERQSGLAVVHVPRSIPRVIPDPTNKNPQKNNFFFLTTMIKAHVGELFPGMIVTGCYQFRITRNSDLLIDNEDIEDLALALKTSLLERSFGSAVRLELAEECPDYVAQYLLQKHSLTEQELYRVNGPVNLSRFMMILKLIQRPDLCYPIFIPGIPHYLLQKNTFFEIIRNQDILLHHPYQSFEPVLELIRQATVDPDVLAIKQTLYRTGAESQMVTALVDAARAGKEVTAVVELRARFDEASNLELATRLQQAGALVVYGVVGYKTHSKMTLIVRREEDQKLRSYVHLSTGNYHARTAREYTDYGFITCQQDFVDDVQQLFQLLTGMGNACKMKKLLNAPFTLFKTLQTLIKNEIENATQGKPARIIIKVNSITDSKIIQELYRASQAGVKIDLIVRGICSLKPGLANISENIRVTSIIGRFLEHSRIFYFLNNEKEIIYLSSADWMERNFYHRVEIAFPIEDKKLIKKVKESLSTYLSDNCQSWQLLANGRYKHNSPGKHVRKSAQETFLQKFAD